MQYRLIRSNQTETLPIADAGVWLMEVADDNRCKVDRLVTSHPIWRHGVLAFA